MELHARITLLGLLSTFRCDTGVQTLSKRLVLSFAQEFSGMLAMIAPTGLVTSRGRSAFAVIGCKPSAQSAHISNDGLILMASPDRGESNKQHGNLAVLMLVQCIWIEDASNMPATSLLIINGLGVFPDGV